jgi:hypothetical protein
MQYKNFTRTFFLVVTLLFLANHLKGQDERELKDLHQVNLTWLGVSYSYEWPFSDQWVLKNQLLFSGAFGSGYLFSENRLWYLVIPSVQLEPRYYYNFHKRVNRGQKTINNSANFISIAISNHFPAMLKNHAESVNEFSIVPKWGMKRTIGKHLIFEFAVGAGGYVNRYHQGVTIGLDLNLGYAL